MPIVSIRRTQRYSVVDGTTDLLQTAVGTEISEYAGRSVLSAVQHLQPSATSNRFVVNTKRFSVFEFSTNSDAGLDGLQQQQISAPSAAPNSTGIITASASELELSQMVHETITEDLASADELLPLKTATKDEQSSTMSPIHPAVLMAPSSAIQPLQPIPVVCLRMSVKYFDDDSSSEEPEEDLREEHIGYLRAYSEDDSLSKVRADLYLQLESDSIPVKFRFLKQKRPIGSDAPLLWVESIPWHKEPEVPLSRCLDPVTKTLMLSSPVSIVRNDTLKEKTVEEIKAFWDRERRALLMEIHHLEAKLAETRRDQEFSPNSSLLKRSLIHLKKEGFIQKDVETLEAEYLKVYSQHDADSIFNSNELNPFRFAWRRMAEDPARMRKYLEGLQAVLVRYRIRKNRLTSRFWTRVLRDMRFVEDPGMFKTWAETLPWTLDETERSAYLGSFVLSDTMSMEEYLILLDPIPNSSTSSIEEQTTSSSSSPAPSNVLPSFGHHQDTHRTIAEAAARFHLKAVERHSHSSATAALNRATHWNGENEVQDDETIVSRMNVPLDHACGSFQVDMLAAQFGVCICGFHRWDHEQQRKSSLQTNDQEDTTVKRIQVSSSSVAIPNDSNNNQTERSRPWGTYRISLKGIGYVSESNLKDNQHRETNDGAGDGGNASTGLHKTSSLCDAIKGDTIGSNRDSSGDRSNHCTQLESSDQLLHPMPCKSFTVDIGARRYGMCVCGHDKSTHGMRKQTLEEMREPQVEIPPFEVDEKRNDDDFQNVSMSSSSKGRADRAVRWVEGEISRLITRVESLGELNEATGNYSVTFGELFLRYRNISDTLVGILVRAKRRKILHYDGGLGDLLLQGRHDDVIITLFHDQVQRWRRERETTGAPV